MAQESKYQYFQFPLFLLQYLLDEPKETMNIMIDYGVHQYALSLPTPIEDVADQVLYSFSLKRIYTPDLYDILYANAKHLYINFSKPFYKDNDEENKKKQRDALIKFLNENNFVLSKANYHYQIIHAVKFFKLNYRDRTDSVAKVESLIKKHNKISGSISMPGIPRDMALNFIENPQNIHLIMAYVAINSLQGYKNFAATNKNVILMRMIGAKSKKDLEAIKNKNLLKFHLKYSKRYHFDKLMVDLQLNGFIKSKLGLNRKLYVSTTLDYPDLNNEIVKYIDKKDFKKKEYEAREQLKELIKATKMKKSA